MLLSPCSPAFAMHMPTATGGTAPSGCDDLMHMPQYKISARIESTDHSYCAVGRITITVIRYCSRASDISESDAWAEGFATVEEFRGGYGRLNGAAARDESCWALTLIL